MCQAGHGEVSFAPSHMGMNWRGEVKTLQCMQHSLAEQGKASLAVALSFDEFQFGHMAFDHAIVDPPGEAIFHRIFVFLDSSGKRLE
jgi:hypothetical protein